MDRKAILRAPINRDGLGIEIGPSFDPVAPKRDGYRVEIIDHMDRAGLVAKFTPHGINTTVIEEVDHVWSGQRYAELTGKPGQYDWVIASHVIEHAPDFVGFLVQCAELLKDDGVLSLAVPDKRYCFDRFRPISSLAQVIDDHHARRTVHSAGRVADFFLNTVRRGDVVSWSAEAVTDGAAPMAIIHQADHVPGLMADVTERGTYVDLHAWCFTPTSFRLLVQDLADLGLQPLREVSFAPTQGCEFYVTLSRNGGGERLERLEALRRIELELVTFAGLGQL